MKTETTINADSIRRGQIYTTDQVVAALGISADTLTLWCKGENCLRRAKRSSKSYFYLGDHIIEFLFGE